MKNKQIDELFAETWEKHYSNVFRDGILCEEDFDAAPLRILCLAKEVNWPEGDGDDMRRTWPGLAKLGKQKFEPPLSRWAYGILNGFPPYEKIDDDGRLVAFKSIAIINVKKTGGGSTSSNKVIVEWAKKWRGQLQKQIEIIGPEVIVSGNVPHGALRVLFPKLELKPSGCHVDTTHGNKKNVGVGRWHDYRIIDFRHPTRAYRSAYDVLRDVFQSAAFKAL